MLIFLAAKEHMLQKYIMDTVVFLHNIKECLVFLPDITDSTVPQSKDDNSGTIDTIGV
jgi:hypothetical protein